MWRFNVNALNLCGILSKNNVENHRELDEKRLKKSGPEPIRVSFTKIRKNLSERPINNSNYNRNASSKDEQQG